MQIIEEIKDKGFDAVVVEYGLNVKEADSLVCLNYDQIESPKFSAADDCRGLILEKDTWNIVCRPLSRFYNIGEDKRVELNPDDLPQQTVKEKLDGSLIKVYNYKGQWIWASRGTVMGNSSEMYRSLTPTPFTKLVDKAVETVADGFNDLVSKYQLDPSKTYLFELITPYNKIVVDYGSVYRLVYLATVDNATGVVSTQLNNYPDVAKTYNMTDNYDELIEMADALGSTGEGFVVYGADGKPVHKIKGKLYVKLHHIRGNGSSIRSTLEVILENEQTEYLAYFPEDKELFEQTEGAINGLESVFSQFHDNVKHLENRDIGMAVTSGEITKYIPADTGEGKYHNSVCISMLTQIEFMIRSKKVETFHDWLYHGSMVLKVKRLEALCVALGIGG